MRYTTVVFDFDGTLVDSQEGIAKGFQAALAAFGVAEEVENIRKLIGPPLSRTIITQYGFTEEDGAKAMALHRRYIEEYGIYEARVYDGIKEMLTALRELGLTLAIATNRPESSALPQLKFLELDHFFKVIVGNNDAQTKGNKSDFVRMAIEGCSVTNPAQAIMIGDRMHDIEGGQNNGIDTIGVLYGYGAREEIEGCKPTYIAPTALDIVKILKNV